MADQTEVQKPVKESINLFIAGVPLTLQTWTKESRLQIQKQSREKGTMLSLICLSYYYICTLHSQYMYCILYRKQNLRNTAQTNLLPGAFICTHLMLLGYVQYS